ncbi:hypothetical protein FQZ97_1031340 [compost metagenome]
MLLERWNAALSELEAKLAGASRSAAVDAVLESFVALIEDNPMLMLLDGMLAELKRGMSDEARRHFNVSLSARIARTGAAIEGQHNLPDGRGAQLLIRSHAFARGLWQSCDVEDGQQLSALENLPDFSDELRASLQEYWRGALA